MFLIKKTLIILLTIIADNAFAQNIHAIRFVYHGEELKPVGTLLISVEDTIRPHDRLTDEMFGKNVKTNLKTFNTIESFVRHSKLTIVNPSNSKDYTSYYQIIDNRGLYTFLGVGKNSGLFFKELRKALKRHKNDVAVIQAFKYYY